MATGDDDGVIAVTSLSTPEPSGQIRTKAILRLKHVGPIRKLAFSPDGHILAALALLPDAPRDDGIAARWEWERNKDRPGVIRLWVSNGWEPAEQARDKSGTGVPPQTN